MPAARTLTLELPEHLAEFVGRQVDSGEYATAEVVALEALSRLEQETGYVERVLREEIPAQLAAIDADPSRLMPLEDAFAELEARWRAEPEADA